MAYNIPLTAVDAASPGGATLGFAAFTGAGAAAPTVSASTVLSTLANLGLRGTPTITRNGAGDVSYAFSVSGSPAKVYAVIPVAEGTSDLDATVRSVALASGVLTVRVLTKTAAGVATDMAASVDFLRLVIFGTLETAG